MLQNKIKLFLVLFFLIIESAIANNGLEIFTYSHVSGVSGTGESLYEVDPQKITGNIKGTEFERVKCGRLEGRESAVVSNAYALIQSNNENVGTVRLSSTTHTKGGHYRTCGICVKDSWCVDISGVDTKALAKSTAKADFKFKIHDNQIGADQIITISSPDIAKLSNEAFKYEVSGGEKIVMEDGSDGPIKLLIIPKPEHQGIVNVSVSIETSSENEGGCCESKSEFESLISVGMQEAALMESNFIRLEPRLVQGDPETGFLSVGLIELKDTQEVAKWKPHCTGTLIKKNIVLTAAHCISIYEKTPSRLRFMVGSEHNQSDAIYRDVVTLIVPKGDDKFGHEYRANNGEHIDDVGIMILSKGIEGIEFMELHNGDPDINNFESDGTKMLFVGFGATWRTGTDKGLGKKHRLSLSIKDVTMRRFKNKMDDFKTTCRGDSGGPALIEMPDGKYLIAGLVSKGDRLCRINGTNTRVQHYEKWVASKT